MSNITHEEAKEIHNQSYVTTLKQALNLTELRTLGIERKGFIKHALSWAIEKHNEQEAKEERAKKVEELLKLRERQIVLERKRRNKTITIVENTEYHELLESCKQLEEELK